MDGRRAGKTRVRLQSVEDGRATARIDLVAVEEPMEIRLRSGTRMQPVTVTMRTPGADFELAAGLLFAEGILTNRAHLSRIEYCVECEGSAAQQYNIVTAVTAPGSAGGFFHSGAHVWDDVGVRDVRAGADRRDRAAGNRAGFVGADRFLRDHHESSRPVA